MYDCFFRDLSPDNRFIALCGEKEVRVIYTPQIGIQKMTGKIEGQLKTLVATNPDFEDVHVNEDVLYAMASTLV